MMKFIWFCAAGYSFDLGITLLIVANFLSLFRKPILLKCAIYLLVLTAALLIFLSATPLASWFYWLWIVATLVWLLTVILGKPTASRPLLIFSCITACLSATALLAELPHQSRPFLPKQKFESLYVIGDSVTAGIGGDRQQLWPEILRKNHHIQIINLAQAGATLASALKQAQQVKNENALVLLEIGGNDLLQSTPPHEFERNLKQILKTLNNPKIKLVMLELPLQPWQFRYGRIQRKLAREFNAILIPKRFFVSVLAAKNATIDLAHLSPTGQKLMAEKISSLLGAALRQTTSQN